ncbi:MAG: hypothetical protein A3B16_02385 [Candidatus Zambryskibacteria bacterium RIFCSPLOWO2_01_FULL_45_43]|uniref:Uncharacterized protein n=1 Tax=Candidatus Zambryskibacteria bacterium RIFCSPLOWO2_01_FULL_45_43 TaxID=1802762 RepID=A0A1G2UAC2_9BACT|nr:MAG: hypothetical protein A3B16_02385 [Candidatus Zambryskibacteria bacterium RIFCSPLOWO2_01_FULL_45_43]
MAQLFFKIALKKGQSLLEVLIAAGIFIMVSTAGIFLFFGGQSISVDSTNAGRSLEYASEGLEAVRSIRNRDWGEVATGTHGLVFSANQWQFNGLQDAKDIFTRQVSVTESASNTKKIISTVSWQFDPDRPQTISLTEQLTNWEGVLAGGCVSDPISGNWANPQVIGSGDIGSGNSGTDIAVRLPYVFVSGTASTASKPDLFVFDVSNPAMPNLVKSINIGANGINSIFIKGNYLYAASPNDTKELIIFNIADPPNASEIASLDLSGSANALGVTTFASTTAIGRSGSASYELAFIDVTNPASPQLMSQIATGGNIYDFYSTTKRLYFVSQESDEDVWIYNIEDPANPVIITNYDIPGTTEDVSIYVQDKEGSNLLVGNIENEMTVIGATNTSQMYLRDRIDVGGDVNDITCVTGDLLFLATSNSGKEFVIVNGADPDNLVEYASFNFPQIGTGIEYSQNKVFMSVRSNDSLRIIGPGS